MTEFPLSLSVGNVPLENQEEYFEWLGNLSPEERTLKNKYHLRSLLENYSNEVPDRIIHSLTPFFKVRVSWWTSVNGYVRRLDKQKILPQTLVNEWEIVYDKFRSHINEDGSTRAEDIECANYFLHNLLSYLENKR